MPVLFPIWPIARHDGPMAGYRASCFGRNKMPHLEPARKPNLDHGGRDEQCSITLTLGTRRRAICRVVRSNRTCATAAHGDHRAYSIGRDKFAECGRRAPLL